MRITDNDILLQLQQTAGAFNEGFQERIYEDIPLINFMTITKKGDEGMVFLDYGEIDGTQDLDNGLIDENTTSLETEAVYINAKQARYLSWAKATPYTDGALIWAQRLGIELDDAALRNLERLAMLTMQKVALVGHSKVASVSGLLTHKGISVNNLTSGKAISAMTGAEVRDFFLRMIEFAFERNGGLMMPNTIAVDAKDLTTLAMKYDNSIGAVDGGVNALMALKEALKAVTNTDINVLPIPLGFAAKVGTGGKARAVVYTNSEDVVSTDWALPPTALPPFQRSAIGWEIVVKAKFTGAIIRQLDKVAYIDYKSA